MKEQLFIRFESGESLLRSGDGSVQPVESASNEAHVIMCAPGNQVSLYRVDIPPQAGRRWRQTVPYLLEEQLVGEAEEQHFALGARDDAAQTVDVAVTSHRRMKAWRDYLSGLPQKGGWRVIPEQLLLPWKPGSWTAVVEEGRILVRTGETNGFSVSPDEAGMLLQFAFTDAEENHRPKALNVYDLTGSFDLKTIEVPGLEIQQADGAKTSFLELASQGYSNPPLDLLQGPYHTAHHKFSGLLRSFRIGLFLLAGILTVALAGSLVERHRLESALAAATTEIRTLFTSSFPEIKRVVNPRFQMHQQLEMLRTTATFGDAGFLGLISKTGGVLKRTPGLVLESVSYKEGSLDLRIAVQKLQAVSQVKAAIERQSGLRATIRSASSGEGGRVVGRLQVSWISGNE